MAAFGTVKAEVELAGGKPILQRMLDFAGAKRAAINMTVPSCLRFLETGRWLNMYEAIRLKVGTDDDAFENEVRARLGQWYEPRRQIEQLLKFTDDSHYARLCLGGAGPVERYGACSVELMSTHLDGRATCFAGDTICVVFDRSGRRLMTDEEVLRRFSVLEDAPILVVLRCAPTLASNPAVFDPETYRQILEAPDDLIEIHIHAPILSGHVTRILFTRSYLNWIRRLCDEAPSNIEDRPRKFDVVQPYRDLVKRMWELDLVPEVAAE